MNSEETNSMLDDESLKCVGSALLTLISQNRAFSLWSIIDILKRMDDVSPEGKAAARAIEKLLPFAWPVLLVSDILPPIYHNTWKLYDPVRLRYYMKGLVFT